MTEYLTRMARDRKLPPCALDVLEPPATEQLAGVVPPAWFRLGLTLRVALTA